MRTLVIACAALTRELRTVLGQLPDDAQRSMQVEYLPSPLHNRPLLIPERIAEVLDRFRGNVDRVFIGYADCGTGGLLDVLISEHINAHPQISIERLPGAHCYEFFAGSKVFDALHDAAPGTFYLTDYLAKHFDALVMQGLGLDRHPELRDTYFGNYTRVVLLSQTDDPLVVAAGRSAAEKLQLDFEQVHTGLESFAAAVTAGVLSAR